MSTRRQLVVTTAASGDVDAVLAFIKRCASRYVVVRHEDIYKRAATDELLFKVSDEGHEIIAVGFLIPFVEKDYYEVGGALVDPCWQGWGIAGSLMPLVAASALLQNRASCLVALIHPNNGSSNKMMRAAGFVLLETYVEELLRECPQCSTSAPRRSGRRCCSDPFELPRKAHFDLVKRFVRLGDKVVLTNPKKSEIVLQLRCKAASPTMRKELTAFISSRE